MKVRVCARRRVGLSRNGMNYVTDIQRLTGVAGGLSILFTISVIIVLRVQTFESPPNV
jgi:hypothetical protein